MQNQQIAPLAMYIERARKILQFEQRTNHQDRAIKPGGLEAFVARWYDETSAVCKNTGLDLDPIHRFVEHLEGYHKQDPMQRAASLRTALAILNELDGLGPLHNMPTRVQAIQAISNDNTKPPSVPLAEPAKREINPSQPLKIATSSVPPAEPARREINPSQPLRLDAGMSQGHTVLALLTTDVTAIPGVGPTVAKRLQHLGIRTIRDLLF